MEHERCLKIKESFMEILNGDRNAPNLLKIVEILFEIEDRLSCLDMMASEYLVQDTGEQFTPEDILRYADLIKKTTFSPSSCLPLYLKPPIVQEDMIRAGILSREKRTEENPY